MDTGYIICTTPRSGSTLLCTLLEATKQAGHPWSFYHEPHFMQEWADAWGLPEAAIVPPTDYDKAYLEATIAAGRGSTSLFGIVYETFEQRPAATVHYICVALGVEPPDPTMITPAVAKLADDINQKWIARYRADEGHHENATRGRMSAFYPSST